MAGYGDTDAGVQFIIATLDRDDPRPVWFCDWGTEPISASNLKRALDKVRGERDQAAYERFKSRLRIIAHNEPGDENLLGDHATRFAPPFPLWVDTFSPPLDGKRWYHRFSELTATAGGFELERDVRTGHGPLGAWLRVSATRRLRPGSLSLCYLVLYGAGRFGLELLRTDTTYRLLGLSRNAYISLALVVGGSVWLWLRERRRPAPEAGADPDPTGEADGPAGDDDAEERQWSS